MAPETLHMGIGTSFLWIALLLFLTRIAILVERVGLPAVLGELFVGIALGNLVLLGWQVAEPLKHDLILQFLAELGVVILLFEVGLESEIDEIRRMGGRVFLVAIAGVAIPFVLGYAVVAPLFLPDLSFYGRLFLGAMLAATSVGITARVFRDRGSLQSTEARMVLGAAVIDDVLVLSLLAVLKAMVESGEVTPASVSWIALKAIFFLTAAIVLGQALAVHTGRLLSRIHPGVGMKFTMAISVCLLFAFLADWAGLAPIVGAFAAGLILKPVSFVQFDDPAIIDDVEAAIEASHPQIQYRVVQVLEAHAETHIQNLIKPLGFFLVPLFFVRIGMEVRLELFTDPSVLIAALVIAAAAIAGKLAAGLFAGRMKRWLVGWGLVPRGEVTLIFAATAKALGVMSDTVFSAAIIVVVITTLLTPPVLSALLKRQRPGI